VAEGGGLLNRYTVQSRIKGSNPFLSANFLSKRALDSSNYSLQPASTYKHAYNFEHAGARCGAARDCIAEAACISLGYSPLM
jgi:hypothetical protein